MIGLDGAGKTTILNKLVKTETEIEINIPSVGLLVKRAPTMINADLTVWDVGYDEIIIGPRIFRERFWHQRANSIIFVIDSTERDRFSLACEELHKQLQHLESFGKPLLVLANKQDLNDSASLSEITELLSLDKIEDRPWNVMSCAGRSGKGLKEGFQWLQEAVINPSVYMKYGQMNCIESSYRIKNAKNIVNNNIKSC